MSATLPLAFFSRAASLGNATTGAERDSRKVLNGLRCFRGPPRKATPSLRCNLASMHIHGIGVEQKFDSAPTL